MKPARLALALLALLFLCSLAASAALEQKPDLTLVGIGAAMRFDSGIAVISQIIPGSPADHDGRLNIDDRIAAVAQGNGPFVNCAGLTLDQIVNMIRGKKGTTVRLQVLPAVGGVEVISLVRDEIKVNGAPLKVDKQLTLTPSQAKQVAEAVKKVIAARGKLLLAQMQKKIDAIIRTTNLDQNHRKILEDAAAEAVDKSLQNSDARFNALITDEINRLGPEQLSVVLGRLDALSNANGDPFQSMDPVWPTDQPTWKDALKQALTPAQAAAWDAAEAKAEQEIDKEIADYLKSTSRFAGQIERRRLDTSAAEVELDLNLPADRVDKLTALEISIATGYGDAASAGARKMLLAMDEKQRKAVIQSRGYLALPAIPATAWEEGLAKLLTPDETKRIEIARADRQTRQSRAMAKVLVALFDDKIAFTAAQRAQFEPIALRLVKDSPALLENRSQPGIYFSYSLASFEAAAAGASPLEIQAILDPLQWQRWQDVVAHRGDTPAPFQQQQVISVLPAAGAPPKTTPAPEPGDVERAISDFLAEKSDVERDSLLAERTLKAEDIARVVHLSPDAAARLQTAARGYVDHYLTTWKLATDRAVRADLGDVTPDTIHQRLDAIQAYTFQYMMNTTGSAWDDTMKNLLTPAQQNSWAQETAARLAYRHGAVAALVVWLFGERNALSPGQMTKLEPIVGKVLADYDPDMGSYFNFDSPWFLQSYTLFLPIMGIPPKELKGLLTKDQFNHWTGSQDWSNSSNYWANIQQNHDQRVANARQNP